MTTSQRRQRRSSEELDRLAREAARLVLEERRDENDVARELELSGDRREVRGLLRRAEKLVRVHVTDIAREPAPLNDNLGQELARKIGLSCALVVRLPTRRAPQTDHDWLAGETGLHEELGRVAAGHLLAIVRPRDAIGVCGGRGVGYTIEHVHQTRDLMRHPAYGGEGPAVSLAGGVFVPTWTETAGLKHVDNADFNALRLSHALNRPRKLCCVRGFRPDEESRDATVQRDAKHFVDETPIDIVVYGAGVVDSCHYLQRITDDPQADAVSEVRERLRMLTDEPRTAAVVIDHCEHFYIAATPEEHRAQITEIVDELNAMIVAITPERIKNAPERLLVAGGERKLPALLPLVGDEWDGPRPTTLITDQETAETLINA